MSSTEVATEPTVPVSEELPKPEPVLEEAKPEDSTTTEPETVKNPSENDVKQEENETNEVKKEEEHAPDDKKDKKMRVKKDVKGEDEDEEEGDDEEEFEAPSRGGRRKRGRKAFSKVEVPTRHSSRVSKPVERLHSSVLAAAGSGKSRKIARMVKMIDLACSAESGENILPPPGSASKASKESSLANQKPDGVEDDVILEGGDTVEYVPSPPTKRPRRVELTIEEEEAIFADDYDDDDDDDSEDGDFGVEAELEREGKTGKRGGKSKGSDEDQEGKEEIDREKKKEPSNQLTRKQKMSVFNKEYPEFVFPASEIDRLNSVQKVYLQGLKLDALRDKLSSRGLYPFGKKSELVAKIAHCVASGTPPKCPKCKNATLRMVGMTKFACPGFYTPEGADTDEKCDFVGENLESVEWVPDEGCVV